MKKMLAMLLALSLFSAMLAGCGNEAANGGTPTQDPGNDVAGTEEPGGAADPTESPSGGGGDELPTYEAAEEVVEDGQFLIPADTAVFTPGEGLGPRNKNIATQYNESANLILALGEGTNIVYTVPEGVDGEFDVYLRAAKVFNQGTSTPFTFQINDGEVFTTPMAIQVPAESPASISDTYDTGTLMDSGRFLISEAATLKAGDTITVTAAFSNKDGKIRGLSFPAVGSILLAPAGSAVATGYDNTVKTLDDADPSDPLSGLRIAWIGSSITYGAYSAGQYSMVEAIQDNHPGTVCDKYAISSTTLANWDKSSYVARLQLIPKDKEYDLFIVQLSTNDTRAKDNFGEVTDSKNIEDFDNTTVRGAIDYIVAYVQETFGCPVMFYSNPYNEKEGYKEMVGIMLDLQEKWGYGVIDMYNNDEMTAMVGTEQFKAYMADDIHPNREGYVEWWTPFFEEQITAYLK